MNEVACKSLRRRRRDYYSMARDFGHLRADLNSLDLNEKEGCMHILNFNGLNCEFNQMVFDIP